MKIKNLIIVLIATFVSFGVNAKDVSKNNYKKEKENILLVDKSSEKVNNFKKLNEKKQKIKLKNLKHENIENNKKQQNLKNLDEEINQFHIKKAEEKRKQEFLNNKRKEKFFKDVVLKQQLEYKERQKNVDLSKKQMQN